MEINDSAFGHLVFDYGWVGAHSLRLFEMTYDVVLRASAFEGECLSDSQRKAMESFSKRESEILAAAETEIRKYLGGGFEDMSNMDIRKRIQPAELVFSYEGDVVLLCNTSYNDENDLGVRLLPTIQAGPQSTFL